VQQVAVQVVVHLLKHQVQGHPALHRRVLLAEITRWLLA
jgi:hypothetical protein